jgi:hypothetical protein
MTSSTGSPIQHHVSIWEGIAITAGALLLVVTGLAGLGVKALNNASDPGRAEAIAKSIMQYTLPGGSKGLFGTNIGGGKIAVVTSIATLESTANSSQPGNAQPHTVELFIARVPADKPGDEEVDPANPPPDLGDEFFLSGFSFSYQAPEAFQVTASRMENKQFCGRTTPVKIQEGVLTLPDQTTRVPAVQYQAETNQEADKHVAILSAVGQHAKENAATVFSSLRCKQ